MMAGQRDRFGHGKSWVATPACCALLPFQGKRGVRAEDERQSESFTFDFVFFSLKK